MGKKLGRPPKPKREKRIKPLRILLSESERAAIDAAAKSQSTESSTWARGILLAAAKEK